MDTPVLWSKLLNHGLSFLHAVYGGNVQHINVWRNRFRQRGSPPTQPIYSERQKCNKCHRISCNKFGFLTNKSTVKLMIFKEENHITKCNSYIKVRFSGSIYHAVLRQDIYCNTISEAAVNTGNFRDVQR